jgi:GNAT superfamily N-acetyltransferase
VAPGLTAGLRFAAVRRFVARYVYRTYRCVVTHSSLAGPPAVDHVGDVRFRIATPSDLDRLEEFERDGRGARHRAYVEGDRDWLFVACDGDRIVATRRVSRVIRDGILSRVIGLGPDQVWAADVYCLPEYRSRGIGRHLVVFVDRYLASLGYRDRFGSVDVTNTASLRMSRAAGRRAVYDVSFVRVLGWERLHVSKHVPRRFWEAPPGDTEEPRAL